MNCILTLKRSPQFTTSAIKKYSSLAVIFRYYMLFLGIYQKFRCHCLSLVYFAIRNKHIGLAIWLIKYFWATQDKTMWITGTHLTLVGSPLHPTDWLLGHHHLHYPQATPYGWKVALHCLWKLILLFYRSQTLYLRRGNISTYIRYYPVSQFLIGCQLHRDCR